ncbi:MAG: aminoglycoside 3-N-acetyltransferase [Roseiflexaceae bacterium]|nr:aminoglycoside 3-N-acetyltransferase [Roseiflexaceae bacterium]
MADTPEWITQGQLVRDLERLGISAGQTLMVHSSVRAVGAVIGGPNTIIQALLDVLTPAGTLMMYVGWQEAPTDMDDWPEAMRALFYEACPAYDPRTARAVRDHGILVECFRTWPGALRSDHPDCSMSALGANAAWLTADHPLMYGYGMGSPLHKLCELGGSVLMLGAPLDTITLLHYAEHRADLPDKHIKRYMCPILSAGQKVWVNLEEYDTSDTVIDADYRFDTIALEYLETGKGRSALIGRAQSYVFEAADLATFGIQWLEGRFGFGV